MAMVVKNNMSAVRTLNTLNSNTSALQKSLQKVSSGMKINSAQDDASGYAISERMRVRIRSLDQANQNSQNDSSLMKTAEGAVGNTVEILRALKEKAINAANDSNTDEDRQTIQKEINQFIDQIDDNALVQFNGKYLVDGSKNNATQDTKTILLNQSLQKGTLAASALTDLNNRAGDSLGIQTTDKYQVSWVQNGSIQFTSGDVGENTIKNILTLKGTAMTVDSDGKKVYTDDTDISQVSATAPEGLISGPTEEEDPLYPESFTISATDAANLESGSADAKAIFDAYKAYCEDHSLTVGTSVELNKLVHKTGDMLFAKDPSGEKFGDDVVIKAGTDATKTILVTDTTGTLADGLEIYKLDTAAADKAAINTTDQYIPSTKYPKLENDTATGDPLTFTKDLTKDLAALTELTITPSAVGDTDASLDLSTKYTTTDTDGNTIPKYYYKDANGDVQSDITAKRTQTVELVSAALKVTGDKIEFFASDGTTSISGKDIFEYNPNYVDAGDSEPGLAEASDKFGKAVYTPDHEDGVAFGSLYSGVDNQISGLTISILDQDGNVKKAANAALDQFKQYQRAENKTGDMSLNFHIGSEANVAFKVGMGDMRSQALGLKGSDGTRIDVYTKEHANAAINVIENALTKALDQQTTIGAIEARLEYTSTNLTTSSENVQAAESTIRDADMAKEMTNYTKSNVLLQAAQAMLAQANQNSSAVLSLLQ